MKYLADVNFWLALAFHKHRHHVQARSWLDGLSDEVCCFCRMTQQGFLRLATNPQAHSAGAVSMDRAWELYDALRDDLRIAFHDEPAGIESTWRRLTHGASFSPHVWNDAYLAAFAQLTGLQVVTFDRGFTKYAKAVKSVILT